MADFSTRPMITKTTTWTYIEKENKWYGVCNECKGEKAKYQPHELVAKGIKPCETCTDLKRYEEAKAKGGPHKE